jgi:hypothetical protein
MTSGSGCAGAVTGLSLMVPANEGPGPFVKIVEDHFRDRLRAGDRACHLDAAGEDETQNEGVDATGAPPTDSLDDRAGMGISHPNEHQFRSLPSLRSIMSAPLQSPMVELAVADASLEGS